MVFDKRDTNICKGIAILFMVLHHTVSKYYNVIDISWYRANSDSVFSEIILFFSTAGKVCVPLLTILSGYGITKTFQKYKIKTESISYIRFVISRIVKFLSIYIPIFILVFIYRFIHDWKSIETLFYFITKTGALLKELLALD